MQESKKRATGASTGSDLLQQFLECDTRSYFGAVLNKKFATLSRRKSQNLRILKNISRLGGEECIRVERQGNTSRLEHCERISLSLQMGLAGSV